MDLSIVKRKLEAQGDQSYGSPEEFVADMRLIFINCANYYKVKFDAFFLVQPSPHVRTFLLLRGCLHKCRIRWNNTSSCSLHQASVFTEYERCETRLHFQWIQHCLCKRELFLFFLFFLNVAPSKCNFWSSALSKIHSFSESMDLCKRPHIHIMYLFILLISIDVYLFIHPDSCKKKCMDVRYCQSFSISPPFRWWGSLSNSGKAKQTVLSFWYKV